MTLSISKIALVTLAISFQAGCMTINSIAPDELPKLSERVKDGHVLIRPQSGRQIHANHVTFVADSISYTDQDSTRHRLPLREVNEIVLVDYERGLIEATLIGTGLGLLVWRSAAGSEWLGPSPTLLGVVPFGLGLLWGGLGGHRDIYKLVHPKDADETEDGRNVIDG